MINSDALREFVQTATQQISMGCNEDALRHLFSTYVKNIFPDEPWWIQEHILGTETHVYFSNNDGGAREGFVDTVVGKTAIEYEKNLENQTLFDDGYLQVKEYCAALLNCGISPDEILGILSDTVHWYGYEIDLVTQRPDGELYGPDDLELINRYEIDLSAGTDEEFYRFDTFMDRYLGRLGARMLSSQTLAMDFGVESMFYQSNIEVFKAMITDAMDNNPDYAELIKFVWQRFIAHLEVADLADFSLNTYINEMYLVTVAKLICADVLQGEAIISSNEELRDILDGRYFTRLNIANLIDYDYFGWLNTTPHIDRILDCCHALQQRLNIYDFSSIFQEDLFGGMLAQLANAEHRLLLGQEYTPHWVAREMVSYELSLMEEAPHIVDMCCGSGVFLIESIKAIKEKYEISADNYSTEKDDIIYEAVFGFDIDPLAVMLAKVNWILAMRDTFPVHTGAIIVPIYHADSLFAEMPEVHGEMEEYITLRLYDDDINLPGFLLNPEHRKLFDILITKCYHVAMTRSEAPETELDEDDIQELVRAVCAESEVELTDNESQMLFGTATAIIEQLEHLQREGKNGLWFFILSNSFRPGLIRNQFNCIISNPPWLAMSKLADNPYKQELTVRADSYGIKPPGAAHPHMELATTFLFSAIDRYLKMDSNWACIMPGSLMAGYNHEPIRQEKFRTADLQIPVQINSIWELPTATFKNKAIVLFGKKIQDAFPEQLSGCKYISSEEAPEICTYQLRRLGGRTAWSDVDSLEAINPTPKIFAQGADLMPRSALFHNFTLQPNGAWTISRIDRTNDLFYLYSDSKTNVGEDIIATDFDGAYIYDALISKHLSPFYISEPAKVLLPAKKNRGNWESINENAIALMNESTAYVFREIERCTDIDLITLFDKINIRNKLKDQDFSGGDWLILSSAGGKKPCSGYIRLDRNRGRLVIDQTLYWFLVNSEEEALYMTGLLNSDAMAHAISEFQPEGDFGERHIHTLPYYIMPCFDQSNIEHIGVVEKTRSIMEQWGEFLNSNEDIANRLAPNSGALSSRRRLLQRKIRELATYEAYENACCAVLGCLGE